MGADLIVGFLEIEKDQEPDWAAAKAVLDAITLDEAWDIVESVEQFTNIEYFDGSGMAKAAGFIQ